MHILILGGGGMVGRKLAERLAATASSAAARSTRLTLHDVVAPQAPAGAPFRSRRGPRISPRRARRTDWSPLGPT